MHSNLPVIPIFIPLLFAAITVLFRKRIAMQRLLTTLATLLTPNTNFRNGELG